MYLEFEISQANYVKVQDIFNRCLRQVVNVSLWKFYLDYIRRVNVSKTPETRQTIVQAYEFAVQHVGLDIDSSVIWKDYIEFVKSWAVYIHNVFCSLILFNSLKIHLSKGFRWILFAKYTTVPLQSQLQTLSPFGEILMLSKIA